ncbi:cofilin family protein [Streptomyces sp. NPDC001935]
MSRDIAVDDSCISAFWELKSKRDINTVIYRLDDLLDSCVVEHEGNLTHDELLVALPANEPRIVIHDLPFATEDGTRQNKILLISWLPRGAALQEKAAYGEAHTALWDAFDGSQVLPVRSTEAADLTYHRLASYARTAEQTRAASAHRGCTLPRASAEDPGTPPSRQSV